MHAPQPSVAPQRIKILDGVRGLAVFFVLIDHSLDYKNLRLHPSWNLNRAGLFGVLLFFSLSAFLLTYPFFLRPAKLIFESRTWRNYALRRFLRIFPLFLAALAVNAWVQGHFQTADVLNHLLLRDGQRHFWTIAVEVKYYFVIPAVVLIGGLFWTKRWKWGLAAAVALVITLKFALSDCLKISERACGA